MKTKDKVFKLLVIWMAMMLLWSFSSSAQGIVTITSCQIVEDGQVGITYQVAAEIPSDDGQVYLFAMEPYEDHIGQRTDPLKAEAMGAGSFSVPLDKGREDSLLFSHFVLAVKQGGQFIEVSDPLYLTNPEAAASYREPVPAVASKKGLLIHTGQLADVKALGTKQAIVNIPISQLMTKSRSATSTTYLYNGKTYYFNIGGIDRVIEELTRQGIRVTVTILNPWEPGMPELYRPGVTETGDVYYYGFNAATPEGAETVEAIATFLGERYSGRGRGRVANWIIGNEIDAPMWDFFGDMDMGSYLKEYERSFRIFYNAIKSSSACARVDIPLGYAWNMVNPAQPHLNYPVRDLLTAWNTQIWQGGNIDWGIAYHPYPAVMTEPEFWNDGVYAIRHPNAKVVNFNNLNVLTDFMQAPAMRDRSGQVRHLLLSEAGFNSLSPTRGDVELQQAAAFAYAYYIAESDPFVDGFLLNRQVDNRQEQGDSFSFGLWKNDPGAEPFEAPTEKKMIWQVFRDIDTDQSLQATEFAKPVIGISRWADVIPGFGRVE